MTATYLYDFLEKNKEIILFGGYSKVFESVTSVLLK
jgi:hypothetical protein